MSQVEQTTNKCADCFHSEQNHLSGGVCSGSLTCRCAKYNPPFLFELAQRVEEEKYHRKDIYRRCQFILEHIPQTRNAGERTFYKIYIEIWHGFKIRKGNPQVMDSDTWKRLPNQDTINREKRRVKHDNSNLATYSPKVQFEQSAIFQALLEMSAE